MIRRLENTNLLYFKAGLLVTNNNIYFQDGSSTCLNDVGVVGCDVE